MGREVEGASLKGSDVSIKQVSKAFGDFRVLKDVDLEIKKGEFFSLLGPSGCGKTTLLRIIAGFEHPDSGLVLLDGSDVLPLPPNKRHLNTVFQNYALFPHLSVFDNIAFPLRLRKESEAVIKEEVFKYIKLVELEGHAHKKPAQLSGGQKQRVAIARALINEPSVLLLDEPLSALDAKLRQHMLIELDRIHDKIGITFIYVTHDQQEALSVSDRIAVMSQGNVLQVGTPHEIYESPADAFVARFIGETNLFEGTVKEVQSTGENASTGENVSLVSLSIPELGEVLVTTVYELEVDQRVCFTVRPEKVRITSEEPKSSKGNLNVRRGMVDEPIYSGFQTKFYVRTAEDCLFKVFKQHANYSDEGPDIVWKDEVYLSWTADDGYIVKVLES